MSQWCSSGLERTVSLGRDTLYAFLGSELRIQYVQLSLYTEPFAEDMSPLLEITLLQIARHAR